MRLDRYLARIGLDARPPATRKGLFALQRAHTLSVTFENLDVQLGVSLDTDIEAAYDKIVERGRGGWCYEQNGLYGWALKELGFSVTRVAAAVMREERGSAADANHLCLLVNDPEGEAAPWLADVGFGGSLLEPLLLVEAMYRQPPYDIGLKRIHDGWRFVENDGSGEFSFDFSPVAGSETALSNRCRYLQTNPDSSFVQTLVAQRRAPRSHLTLRGRLLTELGGKGSQTRRLESAAELAATLRGQFALDVPDVESLWPRIVARHEEVFSDDRT
jgi:N-hydroxyarylamine O-acetyltransferase